jgi:hypothetical protein
MPRAKKKHEWEPVFHAGNRKWRVTVPARLSGTGKRKDVYFDAQKAAEQYIDDLLADREEHGKQSVTADERHWINVVRQELGNLNKLRQVLDHWSRTGAGVASVSAREAAKEFLEWRKADKLNPGTKLDISWRLNAFADHFDDRPMFQITAGEIERWLRNYSEGWARRSMYKRIRPLFSHAKRHRYLVHNPIDDLIPPDTPNAKREVYTPGDYQKLLKVAFGQDNPLWLYLILSGNAFFRSQELVRRFGNEPVLEWQDFLWDRDLIHVREEVAKSTKRKSGNERLVPINSNIQEWLTQFRSGSLPASGRVIDCSIRVFRRMMAELHTKSEVKFIDNGMRKSAISYCLAANPEYGVAKVSAWAGNSESSCRQHYIKMLSKDAGDAWFAAPSKAFGDWFREHLADDTARLVTEWQESQASAEK